MEKEKQEYSDLLNEMKDVYNKFMDEADKIKKENKNIEIKQIPNKDQTKTKCLIY